jgi:pyrroloquinoline quinone biosynthesis protein D
MQDDTRVSLAEGVSVQHLGEDEGAVVLLLGSGQLYTCNDTAAEVLRAAVRGASVREATDALLAQFEVAEADARRDVAKILAAFAREGIVRLD